MAKIWVDMDEWWIPVASLEKDNYRIELEMPDAWTEEYIRVLTRFDEMTDELRDAYSKAKRALRA